MMENTIDTDLALKPSPEAKICLFCDEKKCRAHCKIFKSKLKEIRDKKMKEVDAYGTK